MKLSIFVSDRLVATGTVADVAAPMQAAIAAGAQPLALDDATGKVVDLDLRGTPAEIAARHATPPRRGRPKLGVTAREITLLPRHWDWLAQRRGGASAELRRLVEQAMRAEGPDPRAAQDRAYRAATTLAGDLQGYEEAMRALYAGDPDGLARHAGGWPDDIRGYVLALAEDSRP